MNMRQDSQCNTIAMYIRLSNEDSDLKMGENKYESNSITNQRALIKAYIENHREFDGWKIIEKCDDGFSGVTFNSRPEFVELIEMAKRGEVNCIIVKDFSRLGRDYLEVGKYIEQIFPFLGVRLISINDGYDSEKTNDAGLDIVFKNMIYDFYSRDNSEKVKKAKRIAAEKGEYISPYAIYGYEKSNMNKRKLVVNPESAKVVKEIFALRIAGMGCRKIARCLNDQGIPSPAVFSLQKGCKRDWRKLEKSTLWGADTVANIIRDRRYMGDMVSLRTENKKIRGKAIEKERDEWVCVPNTHEAIVSREVFEQANAVMEGSKKENLAQHNVNIYYCGHCGRKMVVTSGKVFCNSRYLKSNCACSKLLFKEEELDRIVLKIVNQQIKLLLEEKTYRSSGSCQDRDVTQIKKEISEKKKLIEKYENVKISLYEKYRENHMSKDEFMQKKKEYEEEMDTLKVSISKLEKCITKNFEEHRECRLKEWGEIQTLTNALKKALIEKVVLHSLEKIEVVWNFEENLEEVDVSKYGDVDICKET